MRRLWRSERLRGGLFSLALWGLVLVGPLAGVTPEIQAAETATAPVSIAPAVSADHLKAILAGNSPGGLADLRAMQSHIQKLHEQLAKCTVGVSVGHAQGSGVIISKDGYVLTAAHVAGRPSVDVEFTLSDGRKVNGKTLGLCRTIDAGLMKITDSGEWPFAEMGKSEALREGQWCVALGHPGGYQEDRGVVMRLGRIVFTQKDVITTDCTLVGGDSGGPLFDMDGHVIGINSRIASDIAANMHAPVAAFRESWDRLTKGDAWGHYPGQEPYIGVRGEEGATDAKLRGVVPGSPAEEAGLKAGDVILKFDGDDIANFEALKEAVASRQPSRNKELPIVVRRGEETLELKIKIRRRG